MYRYTAHESKSTGEKSLKDLPHHIGIEHMSQEQQKNTCANSNTCGAVIPGMTRVKAEREMGPNHNQYEGQNNIIARYAHPLWDVGQILVSGGKIAI